MIVRLLAREKPYLSYTEGDLGVEIADPPGCPLLRGDLGGSLRLIRGDEDDDAFGDITVLPAADFLRLPVARLRETLYIAYGPVSSMTAAFAAGCADFLREPWCIDELRARVYRFSILRFSIGNVGFELRERILLQASPSSQVSSGHKGEGSSLRIELQELEWRFLRILVRNAGEAVSRAAISYALWGCERESGRSLDVYAARLRKKLSFANPEAGKELRAVRGLGYRLLCHNCG